MGGKPGTASVCLLRRAPRLLDEWRAQARALETYLRDKELQGPMLGTQRRIEGRLGQLLGSAKAGLKQSSVVAEVSSKDDRTEIVMISASETNNAVPRFSPFRLFR